MIDHLPSYYLENPAFLAILEESEIDTLIQSYPFWADLHLLKVAKQKANFQLQQGTIRKAALFFPNQTHLERILKSDPEHKFGIYDLADFISTDIMAIAEPDEHKEVDSLGSIQDKGAEIFILDNDANWLSQEEEEKNIPAEHQHSLNIEKEEEQLIFISSFPLDYEEEEVISGRKDESIIIFDAEKDGESKSETQMEGSINFEEDSQGELIDPTADKHVLSNEEIIEYSPFAKWLFTLTENQNFPKPKKENASKKVDETIVKAKKNSGKTVEKKYQRKKSKKKSKKYSDKSKSFNPDSSLKIGEEIISESLAKLYAKQGLKHKAISMYKALSLKFPEKSNFFAVKIEKLEKN